MSLSMNFSYELCRTDHTLANSPNCCSGQYNTAATCPPSGVTDYSYFSALTFVGVSEQKLTFLRRGQLPQRVRLRLR